MRTVFSMLAQRVGFFGPLSHSKETKLHPRDQELANGGLLAAKKLVLKESGISRKLLFESYLKQYKERKPERSLLMTAIILLTALLTVIIAWKAVIYLQEQVDLPSWFPIRRKAWPFPYWLLEPEIQNEIKDLHSSPGLAVLVATRYLEMTIRKMGGYPLRLFGQRLIEEAMNPGRPLEPHGATQTERDAWTNMFKGVYGALRNSEAHHDQHLKMKEVVGRIFTIDSLLWKLKHDFPDRF